MATILTNLHSCRIRNHKSTENALDATNAGTLPNIVLIEIKPTLSTQPPFDATSQQGFWYVEKDMFSIGSAVTNTFVDNVYTWAYGGTYGAPPNPACITENSDTSNPPTGTLYPTSGGSTGTIYQFSDMASAIDPNTGDSYSETAEGTWDDRVENVCIVNSMSANFMQNNILAWFKNTVRVFVRLKQDVIMDSANVGININIDGRAQWYNQAG